MLQEVYVHIVSGKCVMATRLALYCVCDHEIFMSFEIALFFKQSFWYAERSLGTPCRQPFGNNSANSLSLFWRTQEYVSRVTLFATVFFLRPLLTGLILLASGDQYKSTGVGVCCHAPGFTKLFSCEVRNGAHLRLHWVFHLSHLN